MELYNHNSIEKKWQQKWEEEFLYRTTEKSNKKFYILDMFPYPSGDGLHVGHPKGYIATDVYSRMKKMQGYDVLHPMGFDAFGLPAEQYALNNKVNPNVSTAKNVARYKEQLKMLGLNYDWEREINTTDPKFYKWTQWMWKQMYKKGLAYESYDPINWCPSCKTGLANEDLENGQCERCGSEVEKKPLRQWTIRITDYADRLLTDLDKLDWEPHIKELQRNWIGKSEGSEIDFPLISFPYQKSLRIFTTRADTIYGATFMAISHELASSWVEKGWKPNEEVLTVLNEIQEEAKKQDFSFKEVQEKKGVYTGIKARNPVNGEEIPVYIANYILAGYGTGAIMAVPAHDERDFEFAQKYSLPIQCVIQKKEHDNPDNGVHHEDGVVIDSSEYTGLSSSDARIKITEKVGGKLTSTYKLKDWVFARQRYWGEPFPIVFDENHVSYAVADSELPIVLPMVDEYEPTGTGESPLANIKEWVEVYGCINEDGEFISLPKDDSKAKLFTRETNTMPQWAGSSWYYLRYIDSHNETSFVDAVKEKKWSPVDFYVGGAEHATRHLIYARFWHKFLYDIGVVSYDEPFTKLQTVGLIMAEDGRKMSKRWGNVVNPDEVVMQYGADTLRVYEMFMGPFDQAVAWSTSSMAGSRRFLERFFALQSKVVNSCELSLEATIALHQTIKKVGEDIELFKFNTAISKMMTLLNFLEKEPLVSREVYIICIKLLAPFAPHVTEELWHTLGETESVHVASWPKYNESSLFASTVTYAIQIEGKLRATCVLPRDLDESRVILAVKENDQYKKYVGTFEPKKIIVIKNKLVNVVI
ncbi:MAG: leucine--tRNA ligase [Candidatus Parcubacteria bacterium]|jgi:leucyl-tRNA synthetase